MIVNVWMLIFLNRKTHLITGLMIIILIELSNYSKKSAVSYDFLDILYLEVYEHFMLKLIDS